MTRMFRERYRHHRTGPTARRRCAGVATLCAVALLLAACSSSGGGSTGSTTDNGKPDVAFFKGKTITYIVSNSPGSGPALAAVAEVPGLESYLHATVKLQYIPTGTSVVGQNTLAASKPDGLTIGGLNILVDLNQIYTGAASFKFDISKVPWIASTYSSSQILVACNAGKAHITTFDQLVNSTTPVKFVQNATGGAIEMSKILTKVYNIPSTFVTGYSSTAESTAGCERGDGDVQAGPPANFANAASNGIAPAFTPLIGAGSQPDGSALAFLNNQIPTVAAYAQSHPPQSDDAKQGLNAFIAQFASTAPEYAVMVPQNTPQSRVLALQAAFKYAMTQPQAEQQFLKSGLPTGAYPADQLGPYITQQLQYKSLLSGWLK